MNNQRRKAIDKVMQEIDEGRDILELLKEHIENVRSMTEDAYEDLDSILDEESESRDNMEEYFSDTERFEISCDACDSLENAMSSLEEAISNMEDAVGELENIQ